MTNAALAATAQAAGIQSPSTVMRGFGEMMGLGLSNGIDASKALVVASTAAAAQAAVNTAAATLDPTASAATGSSWLSGLAGGITSAAPKVVDAVTGMANSAVAAINQSFLGVKYGGPGPTPGSYSSQGGANANDPWAIGIGYGGQSPNQGPQSAEDQAAAAQNPNWQADHNVAIGLTPGGQTKNDTTDPGGGHAMGGDFMVGGAGGLDQKLVSMRLQPGELVSVTPGGGSGGSRGGGEITVNITMQGPFIANVSTPRQFAEFIRSELIKIKNGNTSLFGENPKVYTSGW